MNKVPLKLVCLLAIGMLTACAEAPPAPPPAPRQVVQAPPPPPSPDVFFYPKQGQSAEQQARDRYECYLWAHKQTGFDPSAVRPATRASVRVVPVPGPGHDTAVGGVTGAVLGAAVSGPRDTGAGMVIGAVAGAVLGAASDQSRQRAADAEQARLDEAQARTAAQSDSQLQSYRRAMQACLEGRGYTVE
ncbi:MAG: glycine zipper 2TM domain-containing protein [Proteobacteria bacterium]|nr:glycine zipper 2TM domain-containing protein [Pseudomonadota bacterium]